MPMVLEAIDSMTNAEKVNTMEYIWNALTAHYAAAVPEWHKDVLEARRRKIESGEVGYLSVEESEAHLVPRPISQESIRTDTATSCW